MPYYYYWDWKYLLIIPGLILGLIAQAKVKKRLCAVQPDSRQVRSDGESDGRGSAPPQRQHPRARRACVRRTDRPLRPVEGSSQSLRRRVQQQQHCCDGHRRARSRPRHAEAGELCAAEPALRHRSDGEHLLVALHADVHSRLDFSRGSRWCTSASACSPHRLCSRW